MTVLNDSPDESRREAVLELEDGQVTGLRAARISGISARWAHLGAESLAFVARAASTPQVGVRA